MVPAASNVAEREAAGTFSILAGLFVWSCDTPVFRFRLGWSFGVVTCQRGVEGSQGKRRDRHRELATTQRRQTPRKKLTVIIAVVGVATLLIIGALSGDDSQSPSQSPSVQSSRRSIYKDTVDWLADDKDCRSLQARFDDWFDGNQSNEAGSGRALDFLYGMNYSDDAMRGIGCYD